MDHDKCIDRMKQAHLVWMRALRKYGPNSTVTKIRQGELNFWLNMCAPRPPKTEGNA
jgi:hypothetical protein